MANDDGSEQPVREQLKKASIQPNSAEAVAAAEATKSVENAQSEEKTISKKRSYEDITENEAGASTDSHARKRSRDNTAEYEELDNASKKRVSSEATREKLSNGKAETTKRPATPPARTDAVEEAQDEDVASPKIKRSRLQHIESSTVTSDQPKSELPPGSAFANSSSTSGFGSLSKDTSEKQTSGSSFATSKFGALSGSKTSGFGAVGKSSGGLSSFASPQKESSVSSDKPADTETSAFGSAGKSVFAPSTGSAFGSGLKSNGFGSASGFGSLGGTGLSSFASGKTGAAFGSQKPAKPFGAPAEEDEEEGEEDDSGIKSPQSVGTEEGKKDERFYKQDVETGEEGEDTVFQGRAKLYIWTNNTAGKKEWKERGIGVLKLNTKKSEDSKEESETSEDKNKHIARFLMRADGSHRVVLNSPVFKSGKYGSNDGGPPDTHQFLFTGTVDGSGTMETLQLKSKVALELWQKIAELKEQA